MPLVKTNIDVYFMTHDGTPTENECQWFSYIRKNAADSQWKLFIRTTFSLMSCLCNLKCNGNFSARTQSVYRKCEKQQVMVRRYYENSKIRQASLNSGGWWLKKDHLKSFLAAIVHSHLTTYSVISFLPDLTDHLPSGGFSSEIIYCSCGSDSPLSPTSTSTWLFLWINDVSDEFHFLYSI